MWLGYFLLYSSCISPTPSWSTSDQPLPILLPSSLSVQLWRLFCVKHAITAIAGRLAARLMVAVLAPTVEPVVRSVPSVLAIEPVVLECDHLVPNAIERGHRVLHRRMGVIWQEATYRLSSTPSLDIPLLYRVYCLVERTGFMQVCLTRLHSQVTAPTCIPLGIVQWNHSPYRM